MIKKTIGLIILILILTLVSAAAKESQIIVSLLNQDPDPAIAGDIVELRIGLENRGEATKNNMIIELEENYPFEKLSGEKLVKNAGIIGSYLNDKDVKVVRLKVRINRDTIAGSYPLKVKYYEQGSENSFLRKDISIDIKNRESAEIIYIDKVELLPGQITPMKFTINNVGSAPLRELTFSWKNEDDIILPVGSDDTRYIKYIDVGEKVELMYNVIASGNAEPDLYKLILSLTYDDPLNSSDKTITTNAGVYVGGKTNFDVAFSGSSAGETSFSISNIGAVPASSVTVSIPNQNGWRVTGSDSVIIGNLNKGDYTIASFKLQYIASLTSDHTKEDGSNKPPQFKRGELSEEEIKSIRESSSRSSNNNLKMDIHYTDSRGERQTVTKEILLNPSSLNSFEQGQSRSQDSGGLHNGAGFRQQQSNNTKWYIIGAILIIVFFVHKTYKKRKQKDPAYSYSKMLKFK